MDPDNKNLERVRDIFSDAQRLPKGDERDEFIAQACAGDDKLLAEVSSLLDTYQTTCGFLEHDASGAAFFDAPDLSGTTIDHYRLIECIGEGGFGEVYRAEQIEPFKREVALKVIKLGMDTKNVIARFKAEQQALARMNHPNIAQVYDAGATESGRPYFVMELVHGVPILEYCDKHRFPLADRIALFQQVCEGIQHAHKKGILHRDLKPSNILVAEVAGKPTAKIIDFGVAKSLEGRLDAKALATLEEMLIGTPLYMSPEQLERKNDEVDIRSDVYSLGVILYELVAGATPLAHNTPTSLTLAEMRNALHAKDLPRPSKRFQNLGRKTTVIAGRRGLRPPALARLLKGDLDWIILKAIELEPEHRYEDSLALANDLTCFLGSKPVTAVRPGIPRRIRKFFRRHKTTRYVTCSVTATVLICIAIMAYSYYHITKEPLSFIDQRGWKLEKYGRPKGLEMNQFHIRQDGSILFSAGWTGQIRSGIFTAPSGNFPAEVTTLSEGKLFEYPTGIVELPDGIYVCINNPDNRSTKILKVSPDGGRPEVLCDTPILNPFGMIAAPDHFDGINVDPGDLLVFDNGWGYPDRAAIWAVSRKAGTVKPLIKGNSLRKGFLNGSIGKDGILYTGLNDGYPNTGASILKVSPDGDVEITLDRFYFSDVVNDQHEVNVAVHPITGEIFFACRNRVFAFFPGKTQPCPVLPIGRKIQWAPDGGRLYILHKGTIWTLSGSGIETDPVSTGAPTTVFREIATPPQQGKQTPSELPVPPPEKNRDTHFVDLKNLTPIAPYTSWETAANSIGQALQLAASGDTIQVGDGTYDIQHTLTIKQGINLRSRNGSAKTVIDAGKRCRAFRIYAEVGAVGLKGFTITRGFDHGGTGMWISGNKPVTIEDCIITGNRSLDGAGGIAIFDRKKSPDVTIRNCTISNNHSIADGCGIRIYTPLSRTGAVHIVGCTLADNFTESSGGGISCHTLNATVQIENCLLTNNAAAEFGGGIHMDGQPGASSKLEIRNCTVLNNRAGRRGGGINATMAKKCKNSYRIEDCNVRKNESVETGGGIRVFTYIGDVMVARCSVSHNASGQGGGVMLGTETLMTDSLIYGNEARSGTGGGIRRGAPGGGTVINCTIFGNRSADSGGGVHIPKLINSIVYGNSAPQHPDIMPDTIIEHSCSPGLGNQNRNIAADPRFAKPISGNYRLRADSPCIDTGSTSTSANDLDGKTRVIDGNGDGKAVIDMGAYEFQPQANN